MKIVAEKITDVSLIRRACEMTMHGQDSNVTLGEMYRCEHSPMRTQMFWVEMLGIPTFVSVHFIRHKVGVEHFVTSNRDDRGGSGNETRWTSVNHGMFLNAQALVNMARKRLCHKSHAETRKVMAALRESVREADPELAVHMVAECVYRGECHELKSCGLT